MSSGRIQRVVLFLQGPPSGYWNDLARAVQAGGGAIRRVNLCLADQLFWRCGHATAYRGSLRHWRHWLRAYVAREGVTDIVYFADRLPYHRIAQGVARAAGICAHAAEFGYLRPDWLTLERNGNGAYSRFTNDPARFAAAAPMPDLVHRYGHAFWQEAVGEVLFNLSMVAGRPLFPGYAMDKPVHPVPDYLAWLLKIALTPWRRKRAARTQAGILTGGPYWLVGLQLPVDYQLRDCAIYPDQRAMIEAVVTSFARHADPADWLVFKAHPLDNGWIDWAAVAQSAAARAGVADRVIGIDGGDLGPLVAQSRGVIVANSTVGLFALQAGRPVTVLGGAIYDMPGLTTAGSLDDFWHRATAPDAALLQRFVAKLAEDLQVRGSFYEAAGRRLAAEEMTKRLLAGAVGPVEPVSPPPRLAALRRARLAAGST